MSPETRRVRFTHAGPCALAFLASFSIMAVEMAAGRIMAQYVGSGLYTWTSVIGVVLSGITIGNLAGGRLADRFEPRRTLSILFCLACLSCVAIPLINHWVGRWSSWELATFTSFQLRVLTHVTLVFLLSSTILGLIGPVVARLALSLGRETGRTIGNIYAWGALGSILGTFLTGFFLIASWGTCGAILGAAGLLGATGLALGPRIALRFLVITWPLLTLCLTGSLMTARRNIGVWAWSEGRLVVEERGDFEWKCVDESQYSFLRVIEQKDTRIRHLCLDNLVHAIFATDDPNQLIYDYEKIYASITERYGRRRENLRALFIGGGGYIYTRYLQVRWPQSDLQVAEIDPGVTKINFEAFGLKPEMVEIVNPGPRPQSFYAERKAPAVGLVTPGAAGSAPILPFKIYHLDGRNHVEDLLSLKRSGHGFEPLDFVYGDAFSDYCVPFHLVTREFFEKIKDLLQPGTGIYLMNIIDIYQSGRFLGAIYNTMRQVFPRIYIYSNTPEGPNMSPFGRDTFIVVGAQMDLDLTDLGLRPGELSFNGSLLEPQHLQHIQESSRGIVMTDDYSPVENLLDEVIRRRTQQKE